MGALTAQLPDSFHELLASDLTLVALFFVFMLEGTILLYVASSELLIPGALVLAGERLLLLILAVTVLGATVGQVGLFLIAKRGGHEYLLSRPWFRVNEDSLSRFDDQFGRQGPIVVPLSNTILFTHRVLIVPAGLSGMSVKRFLALSALGTVVLESALATLYVLSGQVLA